MSWSGQSNRLRAVSKRTKPQLACAACLHTVGLGFKRIKKLVGMNPPKWTRTATHDPMRFNRHRTRVAWESGRYYTEALKEQRRISVVIWLSRWLNEHQKEFAKWDYNRTSKKRAKKAFAAARRERLRYQNDPAFKVKHLLRKRLRKLVVGTLKIDRKNMTGCTTEHLLSHLEQQFTRGMSWKNQGEWHIDHILPCSSFNLLDVEEQKRCFHWTNLRPMWALENISKGDTITNAQLGLMLTIQ